MNEGYTKVFVSLDGTEQQDFVLARAIKVAANNGAKLIIGHVIDSTALESAGSYPVDLVNGLEEAFKNSIAKQLEEAKANPDIPEVEVMIRAGRIRETLKDEMLDVVKPDLVLCGARGLSSIKYALLGSISTFLLRNTDCDSLGVTSGGSPGPGGRRGSHGHVLAAWRRREGPFGNPARPRGLRSLTSASCLIEKWRAAPFGAARFLWHVFVMGDSFEPHSCVHVREHGANCLS